MNHKWNLSFCKIIVKSSQLTWLLGSLPTMSAARTSLLSLIISRIWGWQRMAYRYGHTWSRGTPAHLWAISTQLWIVTLVFHRQGEEIQGALHQRYVHAPRSDASQAFTCCIQKNGGMEDPSSTDQTGSLEARRCITENATVVEDMTSKLLTRGISQTKQAIVCRYPGSKLTSHPSFSDPF